MTAARPAPSQTGPDAGFETGSAADRSIRSTLARRAARVPALLLTTPLTVAMVLLLLLAALVLHLHPEYTSAVVAWASTNEHNLAEHPVAAMVASMFVVPGSLLPELAVFAVSSALLERAVGARRTAIIALTGQVIATLLTEYGAVLAAQWHLIASSSALRPDVGVSYVVYAVLAASVVKLAGPARIVGLLAVSGYVLVPLLLAPGMTTTGHVLSVAIGGAMMALLSRSTRPVSLFPAGE